MAGFTIVFADGRRETVDTRLSDSVAYSLVWRRNNWPQPTEDALLLGVYTAFAAARRLRVFDGSFDAFQDAVVTIEEDDDAPADPTPAASADTAPADTAAPSTASDPQPVPVMPAGWNV